MRSALVIAYLFPPMGGPGVQRTLSFVRHLPDLGYRPEVIAADPRAAYWARDASLLSRVPVGVGVHRVAEGVLGRAVHLTRRVVPTRHRDLFDRAALVPDRQIPWARPALARALAVGRRTGACLVYATGAPWTNLVVGALAAERLGLPLVVDFRDPWTDGSVFRPASALHAWLHRQLEGWVHRSAARVIANTEANRRELVASFPEVAPRARTIPNGWDEEDFEGLDLGPRPPGPHLRLGFAGNFYAGRGPDEVLALFAAARAQRPLVAERLRLLLVGHTRAGSAIERHGLQGVVEELGYRPLAEALGVLADCDATLVTVPAGARPGWVPQKLYQQLRLGRPIVSLAPPGEAADIAREAGQPVVDPGGPEAAARLAEVLERLVHGPPPPVTAEVVARYDRRALARRLVEVFEEALAARR